MIVNCLRLFAVRVEVSYNVLVLYKYCTFSNGRCLIGFRLTEPVECVDCRRAGRHMHRVQVKTPDVTVTGQAPVGK